MLTSVEIHGYRGIREGKVADLPRLGVLVGPNGAGKSSILETLLIGAHGNPAEAVSRVVRTRLTARGGRWLFHRGEPAPATIAVQSAAGRRETVLQFVPSESGTKDVVRCEATSSGGVVWQGETRFNGDAPNAFSKTVALSEAKLPSFGQIRWLVPSSPFQAPLHDIYSEAVTQGRRGAAKAIISAIIPGFDDIEILVEAGKPGVHVVFEDHSVPVALMGDGVRSLVQLALELAARPGGTVLIEEPEVHEHPAAIRQSAKAILQATRRQIQVLLSTHSLDLIDALLAESNEEDRTNFAVYRCMLDDGKLLTTRIPGSEVLLARGSIGDDLR